MNKTAIKNFAIWARKQLIQAVSQKAFEYEITAGGANDPGLDAVAGRPLSQTEKQQRAQLIAEIRGRRYDAVMEEAAYTWFNRFIALRFMEVNGYLPSKVRIFTDENGEFKPEIIKQALEIDLEGLDRERVLAYLDVQDNEGLYRYLLITQCNELNEALPYMFEKISNWTELLFPANLLSPDSVLAHMVADIPEEDWTDQVQIIGWLYQFYNSELKDDTYALLKKNVKISKERLPSATQLFTPDWIVRYMVENSLGRLAISAQLSGTGTVPSRDCPQSSSIDSGGDSPIKGQSPRISETERIAKEKEIAQEFGWKYYLPEAEQEPEVREQLNSLTTDHRLLPTIKFLDPCMGSGHVLVYAFDVLMQLYTAEGWSERDAARSILENNLYGLDIDTRAGQLAYFAVMMKARKHFRRLFTAGIHPNIFAIRDSDFLDDELIGFAAGDDAALRDSLKKLRECFRDAKEFGSLIRPEIPRLDKLLERLKEIASDHPTDLIAAHFRTLVADDLLPLALQAQMLSQKYDIVCTNPPYMGSSGMSEKLSDYVKKNYPDTKSDMSTAFMERCLQLCNKRGLMSMINIPVWMFISSYEKLRGNILTNNTFISLIHPGRGIFGSDFGTTAFVISNYRIKGYTGTYRRLFDKQGEVQSIEERKQVFLSGKGNFIANQENFSKIPGSPIAYWVREAMLKSFENPTLGDLAEPRQGLATADNNRFLRLWFECVQNRICYNAKSTEEAQQSGKKWFPYNKGGDFRKWYGNSDYVVNWENDGYEIKHIVDDNGKLRSRPQNTNYYFQECASWSLISSSATAFRYKPYGFIFDVAGMSLFTSNNLIYFLGFCNTKIAYEYLKIIAPTINFQAGDIAKLPIIINDENKEGVEQLVQQNITLSQTDWDSFENSWDFKKHPLI